jgi:hypothetical protein
MRSTLPAALEVGRGDESMIPFVMETERTPGFGEFVGRWDEARHRAALADGRHAYFIAATVAHRSALRSCATGRRRSGSRW